MKDAVETTVTPDESTEKTPRVVLSPKQKKIVKIVAAVAGTAALVAVGYKLKEKNVLEAASEAAEAALDAATD